VCLADIRDQNVVIVQFQVTDVAGIVNVNMSMRVCSLLQTPRAKRFSDLGYEGKG
jgi:hypothetical protein